MSTSDEELVKGRWILGKEIGSGSQAKVFSGKDKENGTLVAIKVQRVECFDPCLQTENEVLSIVNGPGRENIGFPRVHYYGKDDDDDDVLVMDHLGPSLKDLLAAPGSRFPLRDVMQIAIQALDRLEIVHKCGYLHRDIQAGNFLRGRSDPDVIYLIDFGFSKRYVHRDVHIPERQGKRLIGTPRCASINAHKKMELSRRDDLISLGYVLVFLFKGKLPWENCFTPNMTVPEISSAICSSKERTPIVDLCKGMPSEMKEYMEYVTFLSFKEEPEYKRLRALFRAALARSN